MKFNISSLLCLILACLCHVASARTFDFKAVGTKGTSSGGGNWWVISEKTKKSIFQVRVGSATKNDDRAEMELRAATVFKNAKNKTTGVNDIATLKFGPINTSKALTFVVMTGTAFSRTDNWYVDGRRSEGWQVAGCIIEFWQNDKMIRHWSNIPGNGGKSRLTGSTPQLRIDARGYEQKGTYSAFDNATEISCVNSKGERVSVEELLAEFKEESEAGAAGESTVSEKSSVQAKVDAEDFTLESICGFAFGSSKPEISDPVIRLQRPFRHYDTVRPHYGEKSGLLVGLSLESHEGFESRQSREAAVSGAAAVFERKYGIRLRDLGGGYSFQNSHVSIYIYPTSIQVRNLDVERKESEAARASREKLRESLTEQSGSGDDVL